ncbi:MAG: hypothetical protein A2868_02630 [Candidatus Levybacteria bacterium RIFCSPHIGHO2_01_FULL_40_15b]|nr:MAG: hypothetical protein A2868_02630 [Candidatus Levybacteria bacterium RIFCSPHIGHO2_01_FULL_40_15b]
MLSKRKGSAQRRGTRYEKKKVRDHGRRHIGGPGKPDARGMEVKDWKNPVSKPAVVRAKRKGIAKFVNKGGFTKPAIDYGKKARMKLYKGKKKLT